MAAAGLAAASVLRWALCRMNGRRACARFDYMDMMMWIPSSNNRTESFSSNNRHNKHQSTPHTKTIPASDNTSLPAKYPRSLTAAPVAAGPPLAFAPPCAAPGRARTGQLRWPTQPPVVSSVQQRCWSRMQTRSRSPGRPTCRRHAVQSCRELLRLCGVLCLSVASPVNIFDESTDETTRNDAPMWCGGWRGLPVCQRKGCGDGAYPAWPPAPLCPNAGGELE